MDEKKDKSIIINYIYNVTYRILVMFIPLITTPYVTRILGATQLGRYSFAYSVATYFGLFVLLGVENYGNRSIASVRNDRENLSRMFWEIYGLQLHLVLVVAVIYIAYVKVISGDKTVAAIMLIYIIAEGININWAFFGLEQFKLITVRNMIVKIISVIGIFTLVKTDKDVYYYAAINVISMLLSQIILWLNLKNNINFYKVGFKAMIKHLKPNFILFIPVISVSLYTIMDKIMIGLMSSNANVGYYEAAEKIINLPNMLVIALGAVMLPRISYLAANNQGGKEHIYIEKSIQFAMFLVTSIGFGIMTIAKEFVPIFYGEGFEICIMLFYILIPSRFFMAFANVIRTQYMVPYKRDKAYIISVIFGAVVNLIINMLLIPKYESIGAAVGTICAEATVCIVQCFAVRNDLPIKKLYVRSIPFFISGLTMFLAVSKISEIKNSWVTLIAKVLVGTFLYLVIFVLTVVLPIYIKKYKLRRGHAVRRH